VTTTAPARAVSPALLREAAHAAQDITTVTGRNLRRLVRVPTLIAFATVQPALFVLLFTYAFGGAIHTPGPPATSTTCCPACSSWPSASEPPRPGSPSPTTWPAE
jgi:hypothetical protein